MGPIPPPSRAENTDFGRNAKATTGRRLDAVFMESTFAERTFNLPQRPFATQASRQVPMNHLKIFKRTPHALALGLAFLALAPAGAAQARDREQASAIIVGTDATAPAPQQKPASLGRSFVPLHSTLMGQGGMTRLNFSGALSIHNSSATQTLMVEKIDYRSGAGQIVESYLVEPIYLKPYASMQIIIAQDDVRAGVGASFTVDWATQPGADEPLIEAVMASFVGTRGYSFLSPGRRVSRP